MRQFSALAAFKHTVSTVISYWQVGLRIALPWMVVITALSYFAGAPTIDAVTGQPNYRAIDFVLMFVIFAAMASISISWHRFVLKDEVPGTGDIFRIDRRVIRYLLSLLGIIFGTALIATLFMIFLLLFVHPVIAIAIILVPMLTIIQIAMIGLPAIAIDAEKPGLAKSFELARNDVGQIALFAIMITGISLLMILPLDLLELALNQISEPASRIITRIVSIPVTAILVLISVGGFTSLYGYFMQGRNF